MTGRILLPTKIHACFAKEGVTQFTSIMDPKFPRSFFPSQVPLYRIHLQRLFKKQVNIVWDKLYSRDMPGTTVTKENGYTDKLEYQFKISSLMRWLRIKMTSTLILL